MSGRESRRAKRARREQLVLDAPSPGATLRGRLLIWGVLAIAFTVNTSIVLTYDRTALELAVAVLGVIMAAAGAFESVLTWRQEVATRQVMNTLNHKLAYAEAELHRHKRPTNTGWR